MTTEEIEEFDRREGTSAVKGFLTALLITVPFWILMFVLLMPGCQKQALAWDAEEICDAVYLIEGGPKAKKPYGILSVPCDTEQECRQICINTVVNEHMRWSAGDGLAKDYLESLARRYAPVGSDTDNGTNKFWLSNLRFYLAKWNDDRG